MDESLSQRVFEQFMESCFRPEVERRRATGALADGFELSAAQLVCFPDPGRATQVRLNDEVRVEALLALKPEIAGAKNVGEAISEAEVDGPPRHIRLASDEDPNAGHATAIRFRGGWFFAFDFRYNRGRSTVLLERAGGFLMLADKARAEQIWDVFAYNLHAAFEAIGKAELLLAPDAKLLTSKTHEFVRTRLNLAARLGNVDPAHAEALNRLADLRPATYHLHRFELSATEADELLDRTTEFFELTAQRLGWPARRGNIPIWATPAHAAFDVDEVDDVLAEQGFGYDGGSWYHLTKEAVIRATGRSTYQVEVYPVTRKKRHPPGEPR